MSDIQLSRHSPVGGAAASETTYTYIGMSEPEKEKNHVYENQSVANAQQDKPKYEFDLKKHEQM